MAGIYKAYANGDKASGEMKQEVSREGWKVATTEIEGHRVGIWVSFVSRRNYTTLIRIEKTRGRDPACSTCSEILFSAIVDDETGEIVKMLQEMSPAPTLEKYIREQIAKIEADERYSYPPADVFVNAPLAMVQVDMKAKVQAYKKVLKKMGVEE